MQLYQTYCLLEENFRKVEKEKPFMIEALSMAPLFSNLQGMSNGYPLQK